MERGDSISFPESVQSFFRGDLGQPTGGFPKDLQKIVLKGKLSYKDRPNAHLDPVDMKGEFASFQKKFQPGFGRELEFVDFLSWKLYPKVFEDMLKKQIEFGDVMRIPTLNFFYGMELHEETIVEIGEGKKVIIELLSIGTVNEEGVRTVFFKVNGQTRNIDIKDKSVKIEKIENIKIEPGNNKQIGVPLQGLLSKILVKKGQKVKKNEPLFVIEAMKMETTITASEAAEVKLVHLKEGTMVNSEDLVISMA
jgi:pyruvate carboxylase